MTRVGELTNFKGAHYPKTVILYTVCFSLVDYELGRMHMEELDRQIVEALTGEELEASDMDL